MELQPRFPQISMSSLMMFQLTPWIQSTNITIFITENPDHSFDRYNPLYVDLNIHHITSKSPGTTDDSTTEEHHNYDTIRAQMDTCAKVSFTKLKYNIRNYKPYTSKCRCNIKPTSEIDNYKSTLPEGE